jgi:hypothetical protein
VEQTFGDWAGKPANVQGRKVWTCGVVGCDVVELTFLNERLVLVHTYEQVFFYRAVLVNGAVDPNPTLYDDALWYAILLPTYILLPVPLLLTTLTTLPCAMVYRVTSSELKEYFDKDVHASLSQFIF